MTIFMRSDLRFDCLKSNNMGILPYANKTCSKLVLKKRNWAGHTKTFFLKLHKLLNHLNLLTFCLIKVLFVFYDWRLFLTWNDSYRNFKQKKTSFCDIKKTQIQKKSCCMQRHSVECVPIASKMLKLLHFVASETRTVIARRSFVHLRDFNLLVFKCL